MLWNRIHIHLISCLTLTLTFSNIEAKEKLVQFEGAWTIDGEPTFEYIIEKIVRCFIPYNPLILGIGIPTEEVLFLTNRFPKGHVIYNYDVLSALSHYRKIDLIRLSDDIIGLELLKLSPEIARNVPIVYCKINHLSSTKNRNSFSNLQGYLEEFGFKLLFHWHSEGNTGESVFIQGVIYDSILN